MNYVFQFGDVLRHWPLLAEGALRTVLFTSIAIVCGLVIGICGAIARVSSVPLLSRAVAVYVEIIRNTPLLVQLFLIYFALPSLGIRLAPNTAAMIGLVLNNGAYTIEILRAGIQSIHKSQIEAGASLGLSPRQIYTYITVPRAIMNVYPALVSQFILLMLGSSIISVVGAEELTSLANFIQSETFRSFEVYIVAALIYVALTILFRLVFWLIALAFFPGQLAALRERLGLQP